MKHIEEQIADLKSEGVIHGKLRSWPISRCDQFGDTMQAMLDENKRLTAEIRKANAREREAFMAGFTGRTLASFTGRANMPDIEQAWQQYRCRDDTDWKSVDPDNDALDKLKAE